jgi:hypothetical protein
MKKNLKLFIPLVAGALALLASPLKAATISADNFDDPTITNTFPTGSLDGYDFFSPNNGPDDVSNASYASLGATYTGGDASDSNFSTLTLDGSSFYTGAIFGSPVATVTLTESLPSFTLGVLTDNSDYAPNNGIITVSLYDSTDTLVESINLNDSSDPTKGDTATNAFYYTTVSGAVAGDTIQVTNSNIGGVTLSGGTVPEPSTYALMGLGLGLLVLAARNRRLSNN